MTTNSRVKFLLLIDCLKLDRTSLGNIVVDLMYFAILRGSCGDLIITC